MFNYSFTHGIEATNVMLAFYLLYFLVLGAVSIGSYVLQSVGLYTIAKRRGIKKAWLSWIPVGNFWILGCISDQYQYVVKGRVKNKRKALLILTVLSWVTNVVLVMGYFVGAAVMIGQGLSGDTTDYFWHHIVGSMATLLLISLVITAFYVAVTVIQYIALNDLYRSCDPGNSVLYLLLSIFVNITLPVFVFVCRNQDLGMPPRKPEVDMTPEEPWEES